MDKKEILQTIKALHSEAPANLETETVCTDTPDLVMASIDEFGSLGNAVREAGLEFFFEFEFNGVRLRTGRVEVARGLLDWAEMHGPISSKALTMTAPELLQVVDKLFGSVQRISDRIGLVTIPGGDVPLEGAAPAKTAAPSKAAAPAIVEVEPPVDEEEEAEVKLLPLEPGPGESSVECQICGKGFKRLGLHLSRTHGVGIDDYQHGKF